MSLKEYECTKRTSAEVRTHCQDDQGEVAKRTICGGMGAAHRRLEREEADFKGKGLGDVRGEQRHNTYRVRGQIALLTITRRSGERIVVKIDADDFPMIQRRKWKLLTGRHQKNYIATNAKGGYLLLHRLLADAPETQSVGFKNHDPFDCRKQNLLIGSHADIMGNIRNSVGKKSGVPYVNWNRWNSCWQVRHYERGKGKVWIGNFKELADAIRAKEQYAKGGKGASNDR